MVANKIQIVKGHWILVETSFMYELQIRIQGTRLHQEHQHHHHQNAISLGKKIMEHSKFDRSGGFTVP